MTYIKITVCLRKYYAECYVPPVGTLSQNRANLENLIKVYTANITTNNANQHQKSNAFVSHTASCMQVKNEMCKNNTIPYLRKNDDIALGIDFPVCM